MNIWMLVVILCAGLGSLGQLFFKIGLSPINLFKLGIGFGFYGLSFILYLVALKNLQLSVAYPLIALSYPIVAVLSWWLIGEPWSVSKSVGTVGLILCIWMIAR